MRGILGPAANIEVVNIGPVIRVLALVRLDADFGNDRSIGREPEKLRTVRYFEPDGWFAVV
jgi:hypothetical protein